MKHTLSLLGIASIVAVVAGCASTGPTTELVDARRAYEQARLSNAATFSPDKLLTAKQALDRAEAAHNDDAGSAQEKHLAYVAQRRAELASVYGSYEKDRRTHSAAQVTYRQRQDEMLKSSDASLESARKEIASSRQELGAEKDARQKAEQRAQAAIASLDKIAQVKEEARGMVITLQGSVLFVTGKSELLPLAKERLTEVATALKETDGQMAVVEGYTDSTGSDDANMKLSQARADAVREYLISQGLKAEMIRAVGRGEASPVASNDTAEGRANNRRVEIVIQPKRAAGSPGSTQAAPGATQSSSPY